MPYANTLNTALRIIDASFNRASEGLRVVEEFARMHLNDVLLSEQAKRVRHSLTSSVAELGSDRLVTCRDILNDVGTLVQLESEYSRNNLLDVVRANFGRVLQSLRSMEEYVKLIAPEHAKSFEELRYDTYSLEKAVINVQRNRERIGDGAIYVLVDTRNNWEQFELLVTELVESQVDFIQLRDKRLNDRELIEAGQILGRLTGSNPTRWIMNDRADLAAIADADGVHLGQTDIDVASARRVIGPDKFVGVSTHNMEQARQAVFDGADYIGIGPCFPSQTKNFDEFVSEEFVIAVVEEISLPAFAIGGIDQSNVERLAQLGVTRFALGNAIVNADSRQDAVTAIRNKALAIAAN